MRISVRKLLEKSKDHLTQPKHEVPIVCKVDHNLSKKSNDHLAAMRKQVVEVKAHQRPDCQLKRPPSRLRERWLRLPSICAWVHSHLLSCFCRKRCWCLTVWCPLCIQTSCNAEHLYNNGRRNIRSTTYSISSNEPECMLVSSPVASRAHAFAPQLDLQARLSVRFWFRAWLPTVATVASYRTTGTVGTEAKSR